MNAFVIVLAMWTVLVGGLLFVSAWLEHRREQPAYVWGVNAICGAIVTAAGVVLFLSEADVP